MLSACLAAWMLFSTTAQEEGFIETFEDPDLPGWELVPPYEVSDGYLHIGPGGVAHLPFTFYNAEVTLRMRRMAEDGMIAIRYRMSESGSYVLHIEGQRLTLLREKNGEEITLDESEIEFPAETWVSLHIVLQDGEQVVSIAEIGVTISVVDPDPLTAGGIMFLTSGVMDAEFDDLEIHPDDTQADYPRRTAGLHLARMAASGWPTRWTGLRHSHAP
jgi:hypothetical protein